MRCSTCTSSGSPQRPPRSASRPTSGFAIVATGGLGRGELLPYSDLDLTLLHDNMPDDVVSQVAELLWYPLWDANIRIDHSVRTVPEALKVAGEDISAGPGHARGAAHRRRLRPVVAVDRWGASAVAHRNRARVSTNSSSTPRRGGSAAVRSPTAPSPISSAAVAVCATFNCSTRWPSRNSPTSIRAGRLASPTGTLGEAHLALLNVRTELHRVSGRGRELLLAQHADEIGAALHIGDRFDLARMLSDAARTISYYVDAGLRTAANALPRRGLAAFASTGAPSARRGRHRVRAAR